MIEWIVRFGRIGRSPAYAWWAGDKRGRIELRLARIYDWVREVYPGVARDGVTRVAIAMISQHEAMHIAIGRDGGDSRKHHYAIARIGIL